MTFSGMPTTRVRHSYTAANQSDADLKTDESCRLTRIPSYGRPSVHYLRPTQILQRNRMERRQLV